MATDYLREKINTLSQLRMNADIEAFQHSLNVKIASETSGDPQVDANLSANAQNSKAQLLACTRRLVVYNAELNALQAELDASTK
jgi:hypothetical protein